MVEYTIFLHTGYPYFGWLGISSQVFSLAFPLFRNKVSDSLEKKSFQEYPHKCWCSSRLHSFLSLSLSLLCINLPPDDDICDILSSQ